MTHREVLHSLLHGDTGMPLYAHEVKALTAAIAALDEIDGTDWRPTKEALGKPGTYINVRTTTTYRWLAYKPDGARQMKAAGRWQRATENGWENATLPDGEFVLNRAQQPDIPTDNSTTRDNSRYRV